MELQAKEVIFYVYVTAAGCLGGFGRQWGNSRNRSLRSFSSRVLTAGLFSFGLVGMWIGRDPANTVVGPFMYLAVSIFIGYFSEEVERLIREALNPIFQKLMKGLGVEVKDES